MAIDKRKLDEFFNACTINYVVKNEELIKNISYRNVYTIVHNNNILEVYETLSILIIVNIKGVNFQFASAIIFALAERYGRPELVYMDKINENEFSDITAYYTMNKKIILDIDKKRLVEEHEKKGFKSEIIDLYKLEKQAEKYINSI